MKRRILLAGAASTLSAAAGLSHLARAAQPQTQAPDANDHSAPRTSDQAGLTGPLHTVTIITPDLPGLVKMYRDGLGMTLAGPLPLDPKNQADLAQAWGIPRDLGWKLYMLTRPSVSLAAQIRVIVTSTPTPAIRKSWSRQEVGPYGMGFPNTDVEAWDKHIGALGFQRATAEIERFPLKRPDGTPYDVLEATFDGPEYLRSIAISRRDGMTQVGDVDPVTGRGGPAYGTLVVTDMDAMTRFLTSVMDFEVRTDRVWRAYEVPFRFITAYAKGARNGHVALAAYDPKDTIAGTGVAPRPPHRGMAMWSFPVTSLKTLEARIAAAGLKVSGRHGKIDAGDLGARTALTVEAPNGLLFEFFEKA